MRWRRWPSAGWVGGFFTTLAIGIPLSVLLGYVLEWAFFSFLYEREHLQQVLMTYGLILVFEELRSILLGDDVHGVQPPEFLAGSLPLGDMMSYPVYRLFISAVCVAGGGGHVGGDDQDPAGHAHPRRGQQPRHGAGHGHRHPLPLPHRVRHRRGPGGAGRHDRRAGVLGLSGHGRQRADHLLRGGGDRRHRLHQGALVAALLVGFVDTFGKVLVPQAAGLSVYLLMAVMLLWKPQGLFKAG